MSLEELGLALDKRLEDLQSELGNQPDLVFPAAFRDQLQLFSARLGDTAREQSLLEAFQEVSELIDEIPISRLEELPPRWRDFEPNLPIANPGVGQLFFASRRSAEYVKATGWLCLPEDGRRDLIVTNAHFLTQVGAILGRKPADFTEAHMGRIEITFAPTVDDESNFLRAKGIHMDPCFDLAVLQLEEPLPEDVQGFQLSSQSVQREQQVVTLGYPGRLAVFSEEDRKAYKRNYPYPPNMRVASPGRVLKTCGYQVEHTCTLAPGSSGSPVLDVEGKVVGVHYYGERWKRNIAVASEEVERMLHEHPL